MHIRVTIHLLPVDEKGESFSIILVLKLIVQYLLANTQEALKKYYGK